MLFKTFLVAQKDHHLTAAHITYKGENALLTTLQRPSIISKHETIKAHFNLPCGLILGKIVQVRTNTTQSTLTHASILTIIS